MDIFRVSFIGHRVVDEYRQVEEELDEVIELLHRKYGFIATAGVWSIVMGVFFAIAQKNEDKEKARKMIKNYVIGLVIIFAILVACPYLVKGIVALIAG